MALRHIDESLAHAMLAPLASWALSTLEPSPPKLVGVEARDDAVTMHVIELDGRDPLADLAQLAVGDVIVLDQRVAEPLDAHVADQRVLRAWPGQRGKHRAIQIETVMDS